MTAFLMTALLLQSAGRIGESVIRAHRPKI
jgi:hypothetical protein